ncbi:ARPP-1 family domain-containing protein [Methanobrevibacter sp. V14]|uniref:ARPP-1 family domain-containing protein n=1 Tax=Methanobrevibacter sp. V14 TaxID=3064280 RepID=UPI0027342DAF|nr:DUF6569 family protein [Methanobrevibacter sp. V14]
MTIKLDEVNRDIDILTPQSHKNITIIPLKTQINNKLDILTLKNGFELGLVQVKECEVSTVNTLIVENNAITPLILIDGEEVIGGDQNRLVNNTIVMEPKSTMKIPVSCTERGRWGYKSEFKNSDYIANYNTRRSKEIASRSRSQYQDVIWSSINDLEDENSYASPTSAMEESYEQLKSNHDKIIKEFEIVDGQNGVLIMINGEIKGFELFLNPTIYNAFHEKILKSYLIDAKIEDKIFTVNIDTVREIINNVFDSTFEKRENMGLEKPYDFENPEGLGKLYLYENQIIHLSYFNKAEEIINDDVYEDIRLKTDI